MHARDVEITNPCHVDWASMTRREASRRFCGACKKHVHDLSSLTESEARALLTSPATEDLCIRTFATPDGELVFKPDVPVSRLRKAAVAAFVVAAPLSLTACMGLRPAPPPQVFEPQPASFSTSGVEPVRPRSATPEATPSATPSATPPASNAPATTNALVPPATAR